MIPILYEATETQFDHGGLGTLSDAISVILDEERNGKFELIVKYPLFGKLFGELKNDRIIKADASHRLKNQRFKIIRITKPMKGIVTIHAEHVSYLSQDLALNPSVNYSGNAQQALQQWANGIVDDHPFTVWSNISHSASGTWTIDKVENPRRALGGVAGSILDSYGGEYLFDNYDIRLYQSRGVDNGIRIAYGKNLIDLEQEEEIASTYTSVYPFVVDEDDNVLTLPEIYIDSEHVDKFARRKILPLDLSQEEIATVDQLRSRTQKYIEQNEIGIPKVNLKVKFIDLANTLEYKDLVEIEDSGLCDWVTIDFEELGIKRKAKVIRAKWNTLLKRYEELEIGEARASLSQAINSPMEERLNNVDQLIQSVRRQANGINFTYDSPDEPTGGNYRVGDTWLRPIEDGHTEMYKWNGIMWAFILSTADIEANKRAIAEAQEGIQEAKDSADTANQQINDAINAAGFSSLDETITFINQLSSDAEANANQAIDNASDAYNLAQTSISEAQTAQENSLTALGKADDALDGVSNLDVRVDDVEAELELKADNTFMNEDGTLTTLSNAITFNAHRFRSDMSRIESRVETLVGGTNLVVLRDAIKGTWLLGNEVYPNATSSTNSGDAETMLELIDVEAGEELALTKTHVDEYSENAWRVSFYDDDLNYVGRIANSNNEQIITVPNNATKMWVSYPTNSRPQIIRGSDFLPYRPNIVDQMTSNEMVLFRNEYDEFADKTERRLTTIDSSGGRLETAENLITQTSDGLKLKADQTTVDELTGEVESLGTEFDVVAGQVSSRVWNTDIQSAVDDIEVGGRNLLRGSSDFNSLFWSAVQSVTTSTMNNNLSMAEVTGPYPNGPHTAMNTQGWNFTIGERYTVSVYARSDDTGQKLGLTAQYSNWQPQDVTSEWRRYSWTFVAHSDTLTRFRFEGTPSSSIWITQPKIEKGNKATDWTPAPEDTMQLISNVETEWKQTAQGFEQSITRVETDLDGKASLTEFNTLSETVEGSVQTIGNIEGDITLIEANVSGLQNTVADKASQTQVTQLSDGFNVLSQSVVKNLVPLTSDGYVDWSKFIIGEGIGASSISGGVLTVRMDTYMEPGSRNRIMLSGSLFEVPGKFNIRIRISGSHGTSARQQIAIGQNGHWSELIDISTTDRWYEFVYEAPSPDLTLGIAFVRGDVSPTWFGISGLEIVPTGAVSESQLSVLNDAINLRVKEGDVMSQINLEAGRTLIDTDRLYLSANTTVFGGSAFIPNAAIESLSADKLSAGTIDAAQIRVINLDASDITTGTLSGANMFLNLNGGVLTSTSQIGNQLAGIMTIDHGKLESTSNVGTGRFVTLSGDQLHFGDDDGYIELTPRYMDFKSNGSTARLRYNGTNLVVDQHLGLNGNHINSVNWIRMIGGYETVIHKNPYDVGGALIDSQKLTIGLGFRDDFTSVASFYGRIDFMQNLHMNGNNIQSVSRVALDGSNTHFLSHHAQAGGVIVDSTRFTIGIGSHTSGFNDRVVVTNSQINLLAHASISGFNLYRVNRLELDGTNGHYMHLSSGSALVDSRMVTIAIGSPSSVDRVADFYGRIDFFKNLNMNGNVINNQSDARLKTNIVEHEQSSLEKINALNFVDFKWIKDGKNDFGVIAQEVQHVAPELVSEDSDGYLSINNSLLNMMTTHAIQELSKEHENTLLVASHAYLLAEQHEDELACYKKKIEELEEKVKRLEGAA